MSSEKTFPFTAADVVATYRKHGVRAVCGTWRRSLQCMCPLNVMAAHKLAGDLAIECGISRVEGLCYEDSTRIVVSKVLGLTETQACSFLDGFDGYGQEIPAPDDEAYRVGLETFDALAEAELFVDPTPKRAAAFE